MLNRARALSLSQTTYHPLGRNLSQSITTHCIVAISMVEPETSRFQLVDDDGLKDFVSKIDSENTRKQVKYSLNIFGEYLEATQSNLDSVEKMPNSELDEVLAKFYVSSRQKNGSLYCKKSMMAIRFGLQRHFLSFRKVDIIKNEDFIKSKRIFKSFTATLKRKGKTVTCPTTSTFCI